MMNILYLIISLLLGYLVGSTPTGYLFVRILKRQDIRHYGSGRTGGTNVGRVLGTWAGVLTAILDSLKAAAVVMAVKLYFNSDLAPTHSLLMYWPETLAGIGAIAGHNWSIFLSFQGGAGTSTNVGAAASLWIWNLAVASLGGGLALFLTSHASVGSMAVAIAQTGAFFIRAVVGAGPWEYVVYGAWTTLLIFWSLRPNIKRLRAGTEREIKFGLKYLTRRDQDEPNSNTEQE